MLKYLGATAAGVALLLLCLHFFFPLRVHIDYSQVVTASDGTVMHAFLTKDQKWRMKSELQDISPDLRKTILYKEDKYFYWHPGINPIAVARAVFQNIFSLKRASGASTITMQVVRMLYPAPRTYGNKLKEMFRALQLEWSYSKDDIFMMYLNLVPYGGNIEGVKAASLLYFSQMPDKLSLAQITALVVIPNRPTSLKPGTRNKAVQAARNTWLTRMRNDRLFPEKEIGDAIEEPLVATRQPSPKQAPHFSCRVRNKFPDVPVIATTLNKNIQQKVSALASNYSHRLKNFRIANAAVLVVNNRTRAVEAYVGSPDFYDAENSGQVDGVAAVRSPGSTLKPLVYALAFDKGILTPKSVMTDVPVNFDGYAPENFNGHFNGTVTVETALSYSLNVPAVKALHQVGLPSMLDKLKQASFEQARRQESLGLSLILGGCGVRLEELAGLFCAFANEGRFAPLKFLKSDTSTVSTPLISPASAYMLSEILSTPTRPDLPSNFESRMHLPKVAWKTGTSYGRRDAWSIGYNKNYTVAVWIGNFSGEGVPELSGAEMATPLLFEIFNTLDYNARNNWFVQPESLDYRLVCPESGKLPDEFCAHAILDYYIPTVSSIEKCSHLKTVKVSADGKYSYCTTCQPLTGYKEEQYPNLAPDLLAFEESEHIPHKNIPPHLPSCTRIFAEQAPKIVSPVSRKEYILEKKEGEIMLSCNADNEVKRVYWYLNDRLYKSGAPDEKIFFVPPEGPVKISCSDDKGRNSDLTIQVKYF